MKYIKTFLIFAFILGNFTFVSESSANPPFNSLDGFVLFAKERISLGKRVQVSSGNLGSNEKLYINKDSTINGDLFADKIYVNKRTIISGNISFNRLKTRKEPQILGSTTTPVSLPIGNLPEILDFPVGDEDIEFEGEENSLPPGNYGEIELEENSQLTLSGGVYNLYKLEVEKNATLIFDAPTTINIAKKFSSEKNTSILPGADTKPQDLLINLSSQKSIYLGKRSFLNFNLLAPEAKVYVGKEATLRGQILARKIEVGKDSVLDNSVPYLNEELGFSFLYPPTFSISDLLSPGRLFDQPDLISFASVNAPDIMPGTFTISVLSNPELLSIPDWVKKKRPGSYRNDAEIFNITICAVPGLDFSSVQGTSRGVYFVKNGLVFALEWHGYGIDLPETLPQFEVLISTFTCD